jgi:hypothetical protein
VARRTSPPDFDAVFAALDPVEREVVVGWLETLDLPVDAWHHVPPLRTLLPMVAAYRIAKGTPGTRADALRDATRDLGMEDTGRGCHPAESIERLGRFWRSRAGGKDRRSADGEAA